MTYSLFNNTVRILLLMALGAQVYGASPDPFDEIVEVDSIVAIVNDNVIVRSKVDNNLNQLLARLEQSGTRIPPARVLERQVMDHLISQELQLQAAKRAGISVDDQTLAGAIGNIARRNNLSISELRDALEADGMSFSRFREEMRNEIIIGRLRTQEVRNRISVTDQELNNFLASGIGLNPQRTEYHVLHILVATPEAASPEDIQGARQKAETLVQELRGGADFRRTAMIESNGREALEGGDLGWLKVGELPSLIADRVATMQRGDVSDPIRTSGGYHIITLEDYKGSEQHMVTQTHARHILITTNQIVSDDDARTRLEQLRQRIVQGDNFATLARSHSDDKASAIKGGDLGWVNPGDLVPQFEEQMDQLGADELSPPFETQFGWHIVQMLERRDHDGTEEILKHEAKETIRKRKADEATDLWLRRLRDEAYVELRLR
jgi:peptidyl-prolyl cis-trans isomerase SurA